MKFRYWLVILLALNLGLLVYLIGTRYASIEAARPIQPVVTNAPRVIVKGSAPRIVTVTNEFHWGQLEAEDYRSYIARLRSIGCPEQTVRDIIIADLDKLLAPRVQSIYGRRKDLSYWHSEEEELSNDFDHREWLRQERQIDREKRAVIQELMGVDLVRERLKLKGYEDYYERRLGFLPEEKRDQLRGVLEQYDDQEQRIREKEWDDGEALSDEDKASLTRLQQQRQAALAGLLSPSELEQYELWMSPTANSVRHDLYGMDASEGEFVAVYKLRRSFDDAWGGVNLEQMDDTTRDKWYQARIEMEEGLQKELGDQRYAEYQRGSDPDYHQLSATVARYKLPRQKAVEVYELKRALQEIRDRVRVDPNLTQAQKDLAMQEMGRETERAVQEVLGEKALNYYLRRGQGQWLHN